MDWIQFKERKTNAFWLFRSGLYKAGWPNLIGEKAK